MIHQPSCQFTPRRGHLSAWVMAAILPMGSLSPRADNEAPPLLPSCLSSTTGETTQDALMKIQPVEE